MKAKMKMMMTALALSACASDPHRGMRADAEQVDSLSHAFAQEAQAYCDAAPWRVPATCSDALASHRSAVAGQVDALAQLADRMDRDLEEVGSGALADTVCGVPAVTAEMVRYGDLACSTADPATVEVAALEHCAALMDAAAQIHARANAVLRATGHQVRVGGSGAMPSRLQPLPTGEHTWPWAAGTEPVGAPMCGA